MLILWSKSQFDILTFSTSNLRFIVLFCGLSTGWWLKTSTNSFKNTPVREKIVDKVIVKNQFDLLRTVRVESILITRCFLVIKMKKECTWRDSNPKPVALQCSVHTSELLRHDVSAESLLLYWQNPFSLST